MSATPGSPRLLDGDYVHKCHTILPLLYSASELSFATNHPWCQSVGLSFVKVQLFTTPMRLKHSEDGPITKNAISDNRDNV